MLYGTASGNVGKDGELKKLPSGDDVLNFSVATDHYDSKTKTRVTEWCEISMFGKRAASVAPFIKKGTSVVAVGEIAVRRFTHNGENRFALQMRASDVKLMGGKKDDAHNGARPSTENDANEDFGGLG